MAAGGFHGSAALLHRCRPPAGPLTVGILQFIAPLQFLLAVAIYDEPFTWAHGVAFGVSGALALTWGP
jgi:hypothetical protein